MEFLDCGDRIVIHVDNVYRYIGTVVFQWLFENDLKGCSCFRLPDLWGRGGGGLAGGGSCASSGGRLD